MKASRPYSSRTPRHRAAKQSTKPPALPIVALAHLGRERRVHKLDSPHTSCPVSDACSDEPRRCPTEALADYRLLMKTLGVGAGAKGPWTNWSVVTRMAAMDGMAGRASSSRVLPAGPISETQHDSKRTDPGARRSPPRGGRGVKGMPGTARAYNGDDDVAGRVVLGEGSGRNDAGGVVFLDDGSEGVRDVWSCACARAFIGAT
jgi:hypothetical protein